MVVLPRTIRASMVLQGLVSYPDSAPWPGASIFSRNGGVTEDDSGLDGSTRPRIVPWHRPMTWCFDFLLKMTAFSDPEEVRVQCLQILEDANKKSVMVWHSFRFPMLCPAKAVLRRFPDFGQPLACDSFESCEMDLDQRHYTRWRWNILTAPSWQSDPMFYRHAQRQVPGDL